MPSKELERRTCSLSNAIDSQHLSDVSTAYYGFIYEIQSDVANNHVAHFNPDKADVRL